MDRKPDINRASQQELERAQGIDAKMAENIVRYREQHGAIRSTDDLRQVPGIGETRAEQVRSAVEMPGDGGGRQGDGGGRQGDGGGRQGDGGRQGNGGRQSGNRGSGDGGGRGTNRG